MFRWMAVIVVALVIGFFVYVKLNNQMPDDLGMTAGLFKSCPTSPNCVSSQAEKTDKVHYTDPIPYTGNRKDVQLAIESYFLKKGNADIVTSRLGYVHLEVKSALIGYIDDVEFYLPESKKVIEVRSASRVGYSDMGVNRKRIQQLRAFLAKQ
ncbi:hypothetical protein MSP8886_02581 [Marinomonas spartinae]|uniref:DUF1499 domain-containing protein n=1 Tax=Marinomonas spartinae TaxID=1792290 RepID=A0A1A8TKK3_9GAMM|nr:DUF1499 domain-containing protein [Marinomonas spartinae]SBS32881.1 hypothetical protein MSP8886_02581 [Marinomonas spartinae]